MRSQLSLALIIAMAGAFGCQSCDTESGGPSGDNNGVNNGTPDDPSQDPVDDCKIGSDPGEECPEDVDIIGFEYECADEVLTVTLTVDGEVTPDPEPRQDWSCVLGAEDPTESLTLLCQPGLDGWNMFIGGSPNNLTEDDFCGPNGDGTFGFSFNMAVVEFEVITFGCSATQTTEDRNHIRDTSGQYQEFVCL